MTTASPLSAPPVPTRAEAFRYWLKLGFISFGGPAGQIAIMHEELVERRRWISEGRFLHALNYCMVLPGPEAQQLATYIGWLMHRTWGGVVAGGLFVLPSLLVLMALSYIYMRFGQVPAVAGVLYGIKPAVTAIVVSAAWRIGSRALRNAWLWGIAAAAFVAIFAFAVPFPAIVLVAALIGGIGGRVSPRTFQTGAGHASEDAARGAPAVIDHDTPTPPHARFAWSRFAKVLIVFLAIWAVLIGALALRFGWHGALTQMGVFFTQAALLTFGGAYAVLPYVFQGAVEHYHWLTAPQMIDGLALGETTPGPLIMVVAFVGFVGGWGQAVFGPDLAFVETEDYAVDPARAEAFEATIRRFWPGLPQDALSPDYAGIRPKLHGPNEPQGDFRLDGAEVHGLDGLMALFGIESPGLTSSLAIGEAVADALDA